MGGGLMSDTELLDELLHDERDDLEAELDYEVATHWTDAMLRIRLSRVNAEIARRIPQWWSDGHCFSVGNGPIRQAIAWP